MSAPPLGLLLDVDGPVASPITRTAAAPLLADLRRLLAAGIPVVEHLTGLAQVPPTGARFSAAPARIVGMGTFPVRAFAAVPADGELAGSPEPGPTDGGS